MLVPSLHLAEQDRHRNELDDTTVSFITQTTKDLVDELSLRRDDSSAADVRGRTVSTREDRVPARKRRRR